MPAHIQRNTTDADLQNWRHIWKFFLDQNLPLFATENSLPNPYNKNFLVLSPSTKVSYEVSSIRAHIDILNSLFKTLKSNSNQNTTMYWNYLGIAQERKDFLEYIASFFWMNQNEFEKLPNYQEIVENPWLALNSFDSLESSITYKLPSDQFTKKSLDFVEMLSNIFEAAEYNPYLIISDKGSFQSVIEIKDILKLKSVLVSSAGVLKMKTEVCSLTEIII